VRCVVVVVIEKKKRGAPPSASQYDYFFIRVSRAPIVAGLLP
jgi:hypothetical protein